MKPVRAHGRPFSLVPTMFHKEDKSFAVCLAAAPDGLYCLSF